jgi:hypothetical protein
MNNSAENIKFSAKKKISISLEKISQNKNSEICPIWKEKKSVDNDSDYLVNVGNKKLEFIGV